jgi:beta-carotene isomerase
MTSAGFRSLRIPLLVYVATTKLLQTVLALQPAATQPPTHHLTASSIPDPLPVVDPFEPSFLHNTLLSVFRWTLQQQSGGPRSDLPGFEGMVQELLDFRRLYGLDEQEKVSFQTMLALSGPIPFIYRHLFASSAYSPAVLAWFAQHLLPFLVGEMELTERSTDDPKAGGVLVQRCRVLEGTQCKGVCSKMCKIPTQRFFSEQWGVPLSMKPNFETGECQLAFGVEPLAIADDPTLPSGCLNWCPAASTIAEAQREKGHSSSTSSSDVC